MYSLDPVYQFLDPLLVLAFRLPVHAYLAFALGILWLALLATVLGELCMAGAYFLNRKYLSENSQDMVRNFNLSLKALAHKDKRSYKACNDLANEAFGKSFFMGITLFASSVWPAFFALGWLDWRFSQLTFPLPLMGEVSSAFFFIPSYIVVRIVFALLKPRLPVFAAIHRKVKAETDSGEKMMTYMDLVKKEEKGS